MQATKPQLFAYIHKEILPLQHAFLHVSDLAIQRGYGVFDFFKVQQGQPLFLNDYLDRFYESARLMELQVPFSREELVNIIFKLIEVNKLEVSGMKMILTGGYSSNGYDPVEPNLIMIQQPLVLPGQELIDKGIRIITHNYVREIPHAKTINYSIGIRLINQIRQRGAADVLYQLGGVVTEFPRCNFFIVKQDDTVVTPADNVLLGITRKNVLKLAGRNYKAKTGTITLDDIVQAKEAFLTSTTKRILPVVQVNETVIGNGKPGSVTLSLLKDLITLEEEQLAVEQ
ncbi:aminotransferase class IV [Pontibacter silvestris]|uniref:branched-chain-amino-acid transaminase n=1 Tax=Pontibacter silvestris TaxID=2305183 RepID=A0ABW4WVN1_9BACT|nr:aminotransferase class IV [Pontibacter silvestris]MCC9136919.1 aminotransferase class IV [Pontibacter silvestris]